VASISISFLKRTHIGESTFERSGKTKSTSAFEVVKPEEDLEPLILVNDHVIDCVYEGNPSDVTSESGNRGFRGQEV
jgi:hypothetical protein